MKDWDKELARIDRQLSSMPDEALVRPKDPALRPVPTEAGGARTAAAPSRVAPVGVVLRLLLALAVAVGIAFWPYDARCGLGLAGYLAAVTGVVLAGGWTAVWTWRHRTPRSHLLSIAVTAWGLALGAAEILPRVGYAKSDPARMLWVCE